MHPTSAGAAVNPIGAHSMLQLDDPPPFMRAMFAEAADLHASAIRLDVAPSLVFLNPFGKPDFSGLNDVIALSQEYHEPVVADLLSIPWWIADCDVASADVDMSRCGTDDLTEYGVMISQIVAHSDPTIRSWEIWNEPDNGEFFSGTPQQYALMLRTAHDAIKAIDPGDTVLLGGMSGTSGMSWLDQVFATPGADAVHAFDVANVHVRGNLDSLPVTIDTWRWFFVANGFDGPLWVTEHGYPSDPEFQSDPSYASGLDAQAEYLSASIPTLIDAGAAAVFVTERDNLSGQFASEGVLGGDVADPPVKNPEPIPKPAFAAVRAVADCYTEFGRDCGGPAPTAAPSTLTLPATAVGSSAASAVTISDPGPEPLQLGKVALNSNVDALSIHDETCSDRILEPDQTCTITVDFGPATGGPASASIVVSSDNGSLTVPVTGVGSSVSGLSLPQVIDPPFTPVRGANGVGHLQQLSLNLTNPLDTSVSVAGATLSGPQAARFRIGADSCAGVNLAPGSGCSLSVLFDPTQAGTARSLLTVYGEGAPLNVSLKAFAFALPAVTSLATTPGDRCLAGGSPNRLLVFTSEPASIKWRARLQRRAGALRCQVRAGALRLGGRRESASGHGTTGARVIRDRFGHGYAARVSLDRLPRRLALRPGSYRLTVTPGNVHGVGASRSMMFAVLS